MSSECLKECPRIKAICTIVAMQELTTPIGSLFSAQRYVDALKAVHKEAESCPGPVEKTMEVTKGIFHKKIVSETRWTCGFDQGTSTDTPAEPVGARA